MARKPEAGSPKKPATKKKAVKLKSQRERFIETARAIGVDETGKEFESLFRKVATPKRS